MRRVRRDDQGAALAMVIGVMAVGMLLSALILAAVINGVGFTSATRAGIQSQAAAEAGVAVARASLMRGDCVTNNNGVFVSAPGDVPAYASAIWRKSGTAWVQGCPLASEQIKILATGTANVKAVAKQSGSDSTVVEAIYTTPIVTVPIVASGPALYSYSSNGFGGAGQLISSDGTDANVFVKTGNVSCTGGSSMDGDLVVIGGNLTLGGSCNVLGNVWASGTVTISGGIKVSGNVVGSAVSINSGTVTGSIWSPGTTSLASATIGMNVYSGPLTLTDGSVGGGVWATGTSTVKTNIETNVVVTGGGLTISNGTIKGNAWASGASAITGGTLNGDFISGGQLSVTGGTLKGDVWSGGTGLMEIKINMPKSVYANGNISFSGGGKVTGSVWTSGNVAATWGQDIGGTLTAGSITYTGGTVTGATWVLGLSSLNNKNLDGKLTTKTKNGSATANGGITYHTSNTMPAMPTAPAAPAGAVAAPAAPIVPDWVDFTFKPADWTGFQIVTTPGTSCTYTQVKALVDGFTTSSGTVKGVIDARLCTNGISLTSGDDVITTRNDLVILAKKFDLGGGGRIQGDTGFHKLWLIQEDLNPDKIPTCAAGTSFSIYGGFKFYPDGATVPNLDILLYTPCPVTISSSTYWRGQLFVGSATVDGGAKITYVQIGLPNVNLTTGNTSTGTSSGVTYELESTRNLGG